MNRTREGCGAICRANYPSGRGICFPAPLEIQGRLPYIIPVWQAERTALGIALIWPSFGIYATCASGGMADAPASGAGPLTWVEVQVLSRAFLLVGRKWPVADVTYLPPILPISTNRPAGNRYDSLHPSAEALRRLAKRISSRHEFAIGFNHRLRVTVHVNLAPMHPNGPIAEAGDRTKIVRDEHHHAGSLNQI